MTEPAGMIASALDYLRQVRRWSVRTAGAGWWLDAGVVPEGEWAIEAGAADGPGPGFVVRGDTAYLSGAWISEAVGISYLIDVNKRWGDGSVWVTTSRQAFCGRSVANSALAQVVEQLPAVGSASSIDLTVGTSGELHLDLEVPRDSAQSLTRCTVEPVDGGGYRLMSVGSPALGPAGVFSYADVALGARLVGRVLTTPEALAELGEGKRQRAKRSRAQVTAVELLTPDGADEKWALVVTGRRRTPRQEAAAGHELEAVVRHWLAARGKSDLPVAMDTSSEELIITSPSRKTLEVLAVDLRAGLASA